MYLLLFIEIFVGVFGLWPADVLSALFLELPTHQSIRKVASFFYGNGVPLRIAHHLHALCNPFWNHHATTDMNALYHLWHAGGYTSSHEVLQLVTGKCIGYMVETARETNP